MARPAATPESEKEKRRKWILLITLLLSFAVMVTSLFFLAKIRGWRVRRNDKTLLTIVNDLLAEINYNPLWFSAQGIGILEPASVPTAANIKHTLDSDNICSLLLPEISRETDVYQAPNVFRCIVSNADKTGPMVATSENDNPQSPLSIPRRGRRIVSVQRMDNIASQEELQAYADRLRNESLITGETINVKTALLPGFGVADVVALHYGEISALCIERGWSMQLQVGGTMSHRLERVVIALE